MAACNKVVFFTILLLSGILFLENKVEHVSAQICTADCAPGVEYMICPPKKRTKPNCTNCCRAKNNRCQLYRSDNSQICT
ncbi:unnamed protein product [Cuscuta europaea]|uniref:Uncharacterized protein n=1 Tax=Cuscuta europaea TaxID=41803 RepID=A0A9P1EJT9_CUSEU|nr:unnamed protein product [Cuscuta europaea]